MRCAITQPCYLPGLVRFAMIDAVDEFWFLDDVQLERQSWQTKNRIKGVNGPIWLSVPIYKNFGQKITEARINYETDWPRKHMESLRQAYSRPRYSTDCLDIVQRALDLRHEILADLTIQLTIDLAWSLGITTPLRRTSELGIEGKSTDRLRAILKAIGATEYLANPGSKAYMGENPDLGCKLTWFDYQHPEYPQARGEFIPYMSIVDLMMNCGDRSLEILREGVPCRSVDSRSGLVAVSS